MYIGKRVKEIRKQKELTLVQLAEKSGVQTATLSRIENCKMTGSFESHLNIARALNVDLTQLYTHIIEKPDADNVTSPQSITDKFVHNDKASYEILTNQVFHKRMLPTLLKIEPQGKTSTEQDKAGSEKFIFILDGEVEVCVDDKKFTLTKNNSFYFDASRKHYFNNACKKTVKMICVVTPVAL